MIQECINTKAYTLLSKFFFFIPGSTDSSMDEPKYIFKWIYGGIHICSLWIQYSDFVCALSLHEAVPKHIMVQYQNNCNCQTLTGLKCFNTIHHNSQVTESENHWFKGITHQILQFYNLLTSEHISRTFILHFIQHPYMQYSKSW